MQFFDVLKSVFFKLLVCATFTKHALTIWCAKLSDHALLQNTQVHEPLYDAWSEQNTVQRYTISRLFAFNIARSSPTMFKRTPLHPRHAAGHPTRCLMLEGNRALVFRAESAHHLLSVIEAFKPFSRFFTLFQPLRPPRFQKLSRL